MFLVLQHPLCDARGFLGDDGARLHRPAWPLPQPSDFMRSWGAVRPRLRGGVADWAGEDYFGDATRAFRFPQVIPFSDHELRGYARPRFRRFFSDGTVSRVEVGLRLQVRAFARRWSPEQWMAVILSCLLVPVRVCTEKGVKLCPLVTSGSLLARHYLRSSTSRTATSHATAPPPWVLEAGQPTLIVEVPAAIGFRLPHSRSVLDVPAAGAAVSHAWVEVESRRCSIWILALEPEFGTPQQNDARRKIRINLLRLHAERECLRLVLNHLNSGNLDLSKDPKRLDEVQLYLRAAVKAIETPERFGHPQSPLLDAARQAYGIALEGQAASLLGARRKVSARLQRYIERENSKATVVNNIQGNYMNTNITMGAVTVSGDFNLVTATNIQNSFNKAAGAEVSDDLKAQLKQLAVEVANLAKALPPEQAEQVSKDLETLTSEAISKKPRKAWYELSAKGLIEAAETVAAMAAPITTAVKAVLALLA